jgi:hypothetical protein
MACEGRNFLEKQRQSSRWVPRGSPLPSLALSECRVRLSGTLELIRNRSDCRMSSSLVLGGVVTIANREPGDLPSSPASQHHLHVRSQTQCIAQPS